MISSLFNIHAVFLPVRQGPLRLLRNRTLKLFRTIALLMFVGLLAVSVRADGPSAGGPGGPGPTSNGGGSDDGNRTPPPPGPTPVGGTHRGAPGGPSGKEYRSGRSADGTYTVNISGYFTGTGTASVNSTAVTISGTVTIDGGGTVSFQTEALNLSGPYFEGNGTAGSSKLLIKGKLDATKQSRLTAGYSTVGDNHHGRIAGSLPTDKSVDNWDDDPTHH
jgi:hypothetical protein